MKEVQIGNESVHVSEAQYQRMTGDRTCSRCGKRPGTEKWYSGDLAATHGWEEWRCRLCVAEVQLAHAVRRAVRIPALVWKYTKARAKP